MSDSDGLHNGSERPIVVVKLGTSSIVDENSLEMHSSTFRSISEVVTNLKNDGYSVAIVCSGALAIGMKRMGLTCKPADLNERKALAAIGQPKLIALWEEWFACQHMAVAQVLLTRDNASKKVSQSEVSGVRKLNLKTPRPGRPWRKTVGMAHPARAEQRVPPSAIRMLKVLLQKGVIPILNENDAVTGKRDMFGNNDELSAVVAGMLNAKYLFILTDVDGLYTSNPRQDENARLIPVVHSVKEVCLQVCTLTQGSDLGTGGMATKITAAELATRAGVEVVICSSKNPEIIKEIILYDSTNRGQDNSRGANPLADEPEGLSSLRGSGHSHSRPPHTKFLCARV